MTIELDLEFTMSTPVDTAEMTVEESGLRVWDSQDTELSLHEEDPDVPTLQERLQHPLADRRTPSVPAALSSADSELAQTARKRWRKRYSSEARLADLLDAHVVSKACFSKNYRGRAESPGLKRARHDSSSSPGQWRFPAEGAPDWHPDNLVVAATDEESHAELLSSSNSCSSLSNLVENTDEEDRSSGVSLSDFAIGLLDIRQQHSGVIRPMEDPRRYVPTAKDVADYDLVFTRAVRAGDIEALTEFLDNGRSPNTCNRFGESIMHMACRTGQKEVVEFLLSRGASLWTVDDMHRTPLHDTCWNPRPRVDIAEIILRREPDLIRAVDRRGASPMAYVQDEDEMHWKEFLISMVDVCWPMSSRSLDAKQVSK